MPELRGGRERMPTQTNSSLGRPLGKRAGSCRPEAGQPGACRLSSTGGGAVCAFASASPRADRALVFGDHCAPHAQASRVGGPLAARPRPAPRRELSLICRPSAPRANQSLRASEAGSDGEPHGVRVRRPTASVGGGASGPRTDERSRSEGPVRARGGCVASNDRCPGRRNGPDIDLFQPQRISRRVEDK
jgi:hypothetical protein